VHVDVRCFLGLRCWFVLSSGGTVSRQLVGCVHSQVETLSHSELVSTLLNIVLLVGGVEDIAIYS